MCTNSGPPSGVCSAALALDVTHDPRCTVLPLGSVAERPNALALKASVPRGTGGSNPPASANGDQHERGIVAIRVDSGLRRWVSVWVSVGPGSRLLVFRQFDSAAAVRRVTLKDPDLQGPHICIPSSQTLLRRASPPLHHYLDELTPRIATSDEVERLQLPASTAVLELVRVGFTEANDPVLVQHMIRPGNGSRFVYHVTYNTQDVVDTQANQG